MSIYKDEQDGYHGNRPCSHFMVYTPILGICGLLIRFTVIISHVNPPYLGAESRVKFTEINYTSMEILSKDWIILNQMDKHLRLIMIGRKL